MLLVNALAGLVGGALPGRTILRGTGVPEHGGLGVNRIGENSVLPRPVGFP
jgi:hypothetical protein